MAFNIRALARPCLGLMELSIAPRVLMRSLDLSKDYVNLRLRASLSSSAGTGVPGINNKINTIASVLEKWESKFTDEGISEPKDSIRNIVLHVMGGQ